MSRTDPELLLQELGGWDWELCRRELPSVLPRLLISFPRRRFGFWVVVGRGCAGGSAVGGVTLKWRGGGTGRAKRLVRGRSAASFAGGETGEKSRVCWASLKASTALH